MRHSRSPDPKRARRLATHWARLRRRRLPEHHDQCAERAPMEGARACGKQRPNLLQGPLRGVHDRRVAQLGGDEHPRRGALAFRRAPPDPLRILLEFALWPRGQTKRTALGRRWWSSRLKRLAPSSRLCAPSTDLNPGGPGAPGADQRRRVAFCILHRCSPEAVPRTAWLRREPSICLARILTRTDATCKATRRSCFQGGPKVPWPLRSSDISNGRENTTKGMAKRVAQEAGKPLDARLLTTLLSRWSLAFPQTLAPNQAQRNCTHKRCRAIIIPAPFCAGSRTRPELSRTMFAPNIGPRLPELGLHDVDVGPVSVKLGAKLADPSPQAWLSSPNCWPRGWPSHRPNSAHLGRAPAMKSARVWQTSTYNGRITAQVWRM